MKRYCAAITVFPSCFLLQLPLTMINKPKIEKAVRDILEAIGEDPDRAGWIKTPARVARMYEEIFACVDKDPGEELTVIHEEKHDELVIVKDIPLYSVCEHHLLPFIGTAYVAYIPKNGRVTGLSKIARLVENASKRPQLQERFVTMIADSLMEKLKPQGVLVIVEAEHLCMTMRGVKKPGSRAITSAVRGIFKTDNALRAEALTLLK